MRKIERHPSNEGSVITFDMYGTEVQLFVADAKYRAVKAWTAGDTPNTDIPSLNKIKYNSKFINPDNTEDNATQTLSYTLPDIPLQAKFPTFQNDKTAKENTDILLQVKYAHAAHWCRCQNISGVGVMDLPNIYELMIIYLESDRLDELDPTVNEYKQYALGKLNPNGRFVFDHFSVSWSSTMCSDIFARNVSVGGLVHCGSKQYVGGVIPVKELKYTTYKSSTHALFKIFGEREIKRHSSNEGSVITFDMYGKKVNLFVADAKYRAFKKWATGGSINKVDCPSSFKFTGDIDKNINPNDSYFNQTLPLPYTMLDDQLQHRFPTFKTDKTSKENTDVLMQYDDTEAAHWCRSIELEGVGQMDLPNIYELMVIYLESDRIDELDPTVNEYKQFALGKLNIYGRFDFNNSSYCWSSTPHTNFYACCISCYSTVDSANTMYENGVVPVKEL